MSIPVRIYDHADSAPALLTEMFTGRAKTAALLKALARPFDGLESVVWDVLNLRQLGGFAYGIHLDWLGKIVGEAREGRTDVSYERAIKIRVRVNRSHGQTSDIVDVMALWSPLATYSEAYPASFEVTSYNDPDAAALVKLLGQAKAVTTYGTVYTTAWPANQTFKWDWTDGSILNAEWDWTDASVVEKWAEALTTNPGYIRSAASAAFDPATLALSGWWRADYAGSPWTPTASAGTSGASGNLVEATNPATLAATQNGRTPADFDGVAKILSSAGALSSLVNGSAGSIWCLFYASAAAADAGVGSRIDNKGLVYQDTGGTSLGIGYSTSGVTVALYDGVSYKEIAVAASVGTYHLVQVKWDGANLKMRVDSGARTVVAAGSMTLAAAAMVLGKNYSSAYQACRILEVATSLSTVSDAEEDSFKSYINSRYNLAL